MGDGTAIQIRTDDRHEQAGTKSTVSQRKTCQWMYADAGSSLGVGGMLGLAHWNPLRWSAAVLCSRAASQLREAAKHGNRPILIRLLAGSNPSQRFDSIEEAISFLDEQK